MEYLIQLALVEQARETDGERLGEREGEIAKQRHV